ncbi:MAG: pseudouridine synthase [Rhodocyclaceae bacterium]|jgi:23S rRNA pseudouridine2604 synthase|nr:MAG: pseudouridine synthase [Rhodocyclaceae bacterium]
MSGSDRDAKPKRPPVEAAADDPWAKWRQPETQAVQPEKAGKPTVSLEKRPKSKSAPFESAAKPAPARAVRQKPEPAAVEPTETPVAERVKPEGTLGVRKSAVATERPINRKPIRGGAVAKRTTLAERAASAAKPAGKPERPANPKAGGDSGGESPWSKAVAAKPAKAPTIADKPSGPPPEGVRLSKVMSERGLCSRREADLWIERGWVFVDGEPVSELGSRINPDAEITVSKEAVKDQAKAVTILLHKPVGYVSGQPEPGSVPAVTLVTAENQVPQSGGPEFKPWMLRGLAPAGRLDVDSTGLLVLTSDGRVAKRLIGEDSDAEKEYLVRVSGEMIKGGLDLLRHGLELDGKPLKPAWVKQLNEDQLHFILKEGKKRQIRRMCELVGLKVIGLKRVRIGRIRLGDLPMGQWRFLRADEAF